MCVCVCVCVFGYVVIHIDNLEIFNRKNSPYVCAGGLKTLMCNFNFHDNVSEYFI